MKKILFIAVALSSLYLIGCYDDKFNELHPLDGYVDTCNDSIPDTYTNIVRNIILANCISCHNKNASDNGELTTYDQVKLFVDNGKLMGAVQHQSNYKAMPPGASLRDCDIQQLQKWIDNGTPK